MQTRRLHESFEGSYSSLASSSGELSRVIASYCSRQWETHAFSEFGGKMRFLGHNFGSRHARRSSKGSIDAGDHLISKKKFEPKFWPIGLASRVRQSWSKNPKTPICEPLPGEPLTQIKKFFFNRTKKTCRIRRGFEQLSSYSGWWVITKKTRANLLARAVIKKLFIFRKTTAETYECDSESSSRSLHRTSEQNRPFCWWWQTNNSSRSNTYISSRLSRMRTDREAQGKAEGPWERHGALGRGIPMLFLRRQRDLGKTRAWGGEFPCNLWTSLRSW